jgi:rare lipoprotein A
VFILSVRARGARRRGSCRGGTDDMHPPRCFFYRCLALLPLAWSLGAGAAQSVAKGKAPAPAHVAAQAHQTPAAASGRQPKAAGRSAASAQATSRTAGSFQAARRTGDAARTGAAPARLAHADARPAPPAPKTRLDYSGRKRVGQASFYARRFAGRKMADGSPMRLNHHNAASKTLPLGTTAKVTNLRTGQSAVVKIQDRGPYVKGRIVDLSPATARAVGLSTREGVAPVEVTPIEVPMPDGSIRLGEAARDPLARQQVARARDTD